MSVCTPIQPMILVICACLKSEFNKMFMLTASTVLYIFAGYGLGISSRAGGAATHTPMLLYMIIALKILVLPVKLLP